MNEQELIEFIEMHKDNSLTKFTPNEAIEEIVELVEDFLVKEDFVKELNERDREKVALLCHEIAVHLNASTVILRI